MRLRRIGACAVAVLALAGLSACRTKAGAAAFVGGHRITDGDITRYLTVKSTPYPNQQGAEVRPKSLVLATLIQEKLFEKALAVKGPPATNAELDKLKSDVLQGATEAQLTTEITSSNFTASFEAQYLRSRELFGLFGQRSGATTSDEVVANLNKLGIRVQVSPRYGAWNGPQLALDNGVDPALSSVLSLEPTATPSPSPSPTAGP